MEQLDDEALLGKIAQDNQQAMECFYKRHAGAVQAFAMRSVNNPTDASEVLNEVMMEVWKTAARFEGRSTVKTWLMSMTRFKSVDLIRRNQRHHHEPEELLDSLPTSEEACPLEALAEQASDHSIVKACIERLKRGHQEVVHLTFLQGCSYPEIADILSIPEGTVKTRMLHAKKQLFSCVQALSNH